MVVNWRKNVNKNGDSFLHCLEIRGILIIKNYKGLENRKHREY
jgi:hypothetical protein